MLWHVHLARPLMSRLRPRCAGAAGVLALSALVTAAALPPRPAAAQALTQSAQAQTRPTDTPAAIPVAEVSQRADEVAAFLRYLDEQLPPSQQIARIEQELAPLSERLAERLNQTKRTIESGPGLGLMDGLADSWQSSRMGLVAWVDALTARATWLEQQRAQLMALSDTWTRTRTAVRAAGVPAPVFQRVTDVLATLAIAQDRVAAQRMSTLVLQDRVARELSRVEDALAQIGQARRRAAGNLFVRESPPIWRVRPLPLSAVPAALRPSLEAQIVTLRLFVADQSDRIAFHVVLLVVLIGFLWWAKKRAGGLTTTETAARSLAFLFDQPVAAALVLGLLSAFWIYADEPRMAGLVVKTGALLPMVLILRRLVAPTMRSGLYALTAFFLADLLQDLVSPLPLLERMSFLLEMLAAAVVLGWFIRSGRMQELVAARGASTLGRAQKLAFKLALAGFIVAFVAGAIGNMSLARLLGSGILSSAYLALVLTAGRRLAEGLGAFVLRVRPLALLQTVEHHRAFLEWRLGVVLRAVGVIAWAVGTLDYFGLLRPAVAGGRRALGASLTLGAFSVSLADVLAFAATVYVAFLVSSLVRFVLEEDVFPRLSLRPGLPYALSSLVRYAIVFVGFILALLALGVNLDRVTVLGGALGVGVGFGLQNIVNNFVSGLIVLFERPVRVGDAVQIGDVQGEVRRIGIRSSTLRTGEGADVIVPNSQLVADRVTNWTPADQQRRIEIQVNVSYGSAPDKVLNVLMEVAQAHPDVVAQPPPAALFLGFGDSALKFQLWAWTNRLGRYPVIKSELGIAVYAALNQAGFSIPFPQQEVRLHQAPPTTP